jgi:hypothetical protein
MWVSCETRPRSSHLGVSPHHSLRFCRIPKSTETRTETLGLQGMRWIKKLGNLKAAALLEGGGSGGRGGEGEGVEGVEPAFWAFLVRQTVSAISLISSPCAPNSPQSRPQGPGPRAQAE